MAGLSVRRIDQHVYERLRSRAAQQGVELEIPPREVNEPVRFD